MPKIIVPKNIEVVIASFGGVGSTFLIKFVSKYKKTNEFDNSDRFKHSRLPLISFNPKIKFVYVFGNPQLAVASIFRRKYHHKQSKRLKKWNKHKGNIIDKKMTLDDYAMEGEDKFHLRDHFLNWYKNYQAYPTLFIRYEEIHNNLETLFKFLEIPSSEKAKFPKWKPRKTKNEDISRITKNKLDEIYNQLNRELDKLNDVEILDKNYTWPFPKTIFDSAYRMPLKEELIRCVSKIFDKRPDKE